MSEPLKSTGIWTHRDAHQLADSLKQTLSPFCDRINIGGSVRRYEPYINDIEIICLPTLYPFNEMVPVEQPIYDLFNQISGYVEVKEPGIVYRRHEDFIKLINSWTHVKGSAENGRYCQRILPEGIKIDLFMPQTHDYFRHLAIRTGSENFVREYISKGWVVKGWRGTDDGLRLDYQCEEKSGKYVCIVDDPTLPPVWKSEEEFFHWLGYAYVLPKNRI